MDEASGVVAGAVAEASGAVAGAAAAAAGAAAVESEVLAALALSDFWQVSATDFTLLTL